LNIDLGQVEGAFIQGLGWLTCEELVWNSEGKLLTSGPSNYKIPAIGDLPSDFRVKLHTEDNKEATIYRSKAVGEPPLMLANSAWLAIRDALCAIAGDKKVDLNAPATPVEVFRVIQNLKK
jgi:xanthine dehydrogenase large subunit